MGWDGACYLGGVLVSGFIFLHSLPEGLHTVCSRQGQGVEVLRSRVGNSFIFYLCVNEPPVAVFVLVCEEK